MIGVSNVRASTFQYLCDNGISCHVWYYDDCIRHDVELYGTLQKGLTDGIYRIGMNRFDVDNVKRVKYADHLTDGVIFKDFKFEIKDGKKSGE